MTVFTRSSEYRKQLHAFFLTNKAAVRSQLDAAVATGGTHAPSISVVSPTVTTVILPGVSAAGDKGSPQVAINDGQQPASSAVFEEDFSSYTDSADWRTDPNNWYNWLPTSSQQFIDTSITDPEVTTSSQSLRLEYLPGICGGLTLGFDITSWQDGRVIADISPDVTEIWIEMRVRFDSDWNTNDTNSCVEPENHELIRAFVGSQGQDPYFQLNDGAGVNSYWHFGAPPDNAGQGQTEDAHDSLSYSNNNWNVVRCHYKLSEVTKTIPDGIAFNEINGQRIVGRNTGFTGDDIITVAVDPLGTGETYNNFTKIQFGGILKPLKTTPTQKLWISQARVYDADPGWTTGESNLPEGAWVDIVDRPFNELGESTATTEPMSEFAMTSVDFIAGDGTNYKSPAGMMKINYGIGHPNGNATMSTTADFSTTHSTNTNAKTECYWAMWVKVSANYWGNAVNKIGFFTNTRTDGSIANATVPTIFGTDDGELTLQVRMQSLLGDAIAGVDGARNLGANVTSAPMARDEWHFIEIYCKHNTGGLDNGEVHAWLNGSKRLQYTDLSYDDGSLGGSNVSRFTRWRFNNTWGGGPNATNPVTSFWHVDHNIFKVR